jgi:hypothetical protein
MQVLPQNPATVPLQASTPLNIVSATVQVSHVVSGSITNVLNATNLVNVSTGVWLYNWTPVSLTPDNYVASYVFTDSGGNTWVATEDLIVPIDLVRSRQGVTNKYVRSAISSTATLYDDDNSTVVAQLDLFQQDLLTPAGTSTAFSRVPT